MAVGGKGFTLIEVMIVVAVIGLLAALSIPIYQGYVAKTQINRAVSELGRYRPVVDYAISSNSALTNGAIGYVPSDITSGNTTSDITTFNADGSGHLQVTLGGNVHSSLAGVIIIYQRSANGRWRCVIDYSANPGGWSNLFMPEGCGI